MTKSIDDLVQHAAKLANVTPLFLTLMSVLAACATVPQPAAPGSGPRGVAVLQQCADAVGDASLGKLHDINIHLVGHWSPLIGRIQPTLVDDRFRGTSDERYQLRPPVTTQTHHGVGGVKTVTRDDHDTRVTYNSKPNTDKDVLDAAALVADGYRMFLLGPAFFLERHADVRYLQCDCINGHDCDDLLATLRPGIGASVEDRVIVSIDRQSHLIRRYRMTVHGLANAPRAVADIFCDDYIRFNGVAVPTRFYEELKNPFDASVHHWTLTSIDFHREAPPAGTAPLSAAQETPGKYDLTPHHL